MKPFRLVSRAFSMSKETAQLEKQQIMSIEATLTQAEKKYLNFLAQAVEDLNALEKKQLWKKLQEKSIENFEIKLASQEPAPETGK